MQHNDFVRRKDLTDKQMLFMLCLAEREAVERNDVSDFIEGIGWVISEDLVESQKRDVELSMIEAFYGQDLLEKISQKNSSEAEKYINYALKKIDEFIQTQPEEDKKKVREIIDIVKNRLQGIFARIEVNY